MSCPDPNIVYQQRLEESGSRLGSLVVDIAALVAVVAASVVVLVLFASFADLALVAQQPAVLAAHSRIQTRIRTDPLAEFVLSRCKGAVSF
jgi:hypothetical protein